LRFIIVLILFIISLQPNSGHAYVYQTFLRETNITIEINKQDLQSLGSWPIERRWYGLAIENLIRKGADSIFIDIAFPDADPMNAESDRFFYQVLMKHQHIFIQHEYNRSESDSLLILGSSPFPPGRIILPLSESFEISGNLFLLTKSPEKSLTNHLLPEQAISPPVGLVIPDHLPNPDFTFSEILKDNFYFEPGSNVFLYLNHPGFTSYIAAGNNRGLPASQLQWWAVNNIKNGNFVYPWPHWRYVIFAVALIIPGILAYFRNRSLFYFVCGVYVLEIVIIAVLFGFHIYLPPYLYFSALFPIPAFLFNYIRYRSVRRLPEDYFAKPGNKLSRDERKELEDLRYRVGFYDKLKNAAFQDAEEIDSESIIFHNSSPVASLLVKAKNVAKTNIPILISGESGTGKEELASFIHHHSNRADYGFFALNCGSLNENLVESELFGYEKGAFTGAVKTKKGQFELADGGTLFLDEIAETSPAFQVKLLRVLQEGKFQRVGGTETHQASVRIIAATHQDINELVKNNSFREDLYYRLNGFTFHLPPLRNRKMDIPVLFKYFVNDIAGNDDLKYSDSLLEWLQNLTWSGNVRELKAATTRAVLNAKIHKRTVLLPEDFEIEEPNQTRDGKAEQLLELFKANSDKYRFISDVAKIIDLHRVTVTEYFRGWIIYYLSRDLNPAQIAAEITNDHTDRDGQEQLARRIQSYEKNIKSRILEGLNNRLDPKEIEDRYFSQLPKYFSDDLHALVRIYKLETKTR